MKNYSERMDKLFGSSAWKHRSLRTLFDPFSHEYTQTTLEQKLEILQKIAENDDLQSVIKEYEYYYRFELTGKVHVAKDLWEGLARLLQAVLTVPKEHSATKSIIE